MASRGEIRTSAGQFALFDPMQDFIAKLTIQTCRRDPTLRTWSREVAAGLIPGPRRAHIWVQSGAWTSEASFCLLLFARAPQRGSFDSIGARRD